MPTVRSPCTLECPRTGHSPAPGRPMLPCSSSTFTTSRSIGTECLCCVSPIAQQTMVAFEVRTASPTRRSAFSGSPVAATRSGHEASVIAFSYSSKPLVCSAMNAWSSTPPVDASASSRCLPIAWKSAWSPPRRICTNSSASFVPPKATPRTVCGFSNRMSPASGSGLTAMIVAPLRFAFSSALSMRGWFVPGFCPATISRSASWTSSIETVPLPMPIVSVSAEPDGLVAHVRAVRQVVRADARARAAGTGTPPRSTCAPTCRRPPRRDRRAPAAPRRPRAARRPTRSGGSASHPPRGSSAR